MGSNLANIPRDRKTDFFCFIILLFNFLFVGFRANAQQTAFSHIDVEEGLSKSSVLSICRDVDGFIWFGTTLGLNKYDGLKFTVFKHDPLNPKSIADNDIEALLIVRNKKLWIGTSNGLDIYNSASDTFEHIITGESITSLFQDKNGIIWASSFNGLFYIKDKKVFNFSQLNADAKLLFPGPVWCVSGDHNGNIWVGTTHGLFRLNPKNGKYQITHVEYRKQDSQVIGANDVTAILENNEHLLWVGYRHAGLDLLDPISKNFEHFGHNTNDKSSLINDNIRKLLVDNHNNLWVGTQEGISVIGTANHHINNFDHDPANPNSISQNSIYEIYKDEYGTIWIGTYFGGINQFNSISAPFSVYQSNSYRNSINSNIISAIVADKKRNFWIGTEAEGLNYLDRATGKFSYYKSSSTDKNSLSSNLIKAIFVDGDDKVWIGMSRGGMDELNPVNNSFTHYRYDPHSKWGLNSDYVGCILKDSKGRFWVGTDQGLNLFNQQSKKFENHFNNPEKFKNVAKGVNVILEDRHHHIWLGTSSALIELKDNDTVFSVVPLNKAIDFKSHQINCIKEDTNGCIWIGADNLGLIAYHPESSAFKVFNVNCGLPSNSILGILQDDQGSIWVSTDNGISKYDPKKEEFENYGLQDGLPGKEFNNSSYFKDERGNLYFGGYNGLVFFHPSQIKQNPYPPKIVFTSLNLFNNPVKVNDDSHLLKRTIGTTSEITFTSAQNVFTLNFAALNLIKPLKNKYAFKLEGFEKNWNYVTIPTATYTNLSSGTYTLLVKGSNNDGVWSTAPASMTITILPPLWKTWWAYLSYIIVIFLIIYYVIRFFQVRAKLKYELELEHQELEQQREIHQMKLNFYTNVSHEIRTPLTLILAPVEKLMTLTRDNKSIQLYLNSVKTNTDRLNKLINELLDFRKAESGKIQLQVSEYNIVSYGHDIFTSFNDLAKSKEMDFEFTSSDDVIPVFFDKYQLEKVFYNLLSNAFKFTQAKGKITLDIRKNTHANTVEINVNDNGQGIPMQSLNKIFQNFYQINNSNPGSVGTGIGLALTKSIVELHGGIIKVDSKLATNEQAGSTHFKVILQLGSSHLANAHIIDDQLQPEALPVLQIDSLADQIDDPGDEKQVKEKSYTILVVEDNNEVRDFIKNALKAFYRVETQYNGLKGWDAALRIMPDLIISDVMMPIMDGFELCKKIKTDNRTSHIPVILLTALSDLSQRISGLQEGADAYITKPFSVQLLQLNIQNMLALREAVKKRHSQNLFLGPRPLIDNSQDDKLLQKLVQIIDQNIDNAELSLSELTLELGMSKSVLYKKFSALTDLSLTDFIKNQRLKKAAELLKEPEISIADIAHRVGFNDVKYFSKEFKKVYGVTPSQYLKNC